MVLKKSSLLLFGPHSRINIKNNDKSVSLFYTQVQKV